MSENFFPNQIERFKREAKTVAKSSGCTHSESLDRIAKREGWTNWSLLSKNSRTKVIPPFFLYSRSIEQVGASLRPRSGKLPESVVEEIGLHYVSAENAVEYAISYMQALLQRPRYKVHSSSLAYREMRSWLPYRIHETATPGKWILVNREYGPVGMLKTEKWLDYEDFTNAQIVAMNDEVVALSHPDHESSGGIFGDGSSPWGSRKDAQMYLNRLQALRAFISRD